MHSIPWTLQRYIFREMGKTFLLTAAGLAVLFGLGGGVVNTIELGEATPRQFLQLMLIVLPLASALTLPIAALYSAASTYGRLSADNEFVACRSSGINIHVLFLPAVVISLISAMFSFMVINFFIPSRVRDLNSLIRSNFASIIEQRLTQPGGMPLSEKYRVFANEVEIADESGSRIDIANVQFVEMDGSEWAKIGVIGQLSLSIDQEDGQTQVRGVGRNLSFYDIGTGQIVEMDAQQVQRAVPMGLPMQLKHLNLWELLDYYRRPHEWREAAAALGKLRVAVGSRMVYDRLMEQFNGEGTVTLGDATHRYRISAEHAAQLPRAGTIDLQKVVVEEDDLLNNSSERYEAESGWIEIPRSDATDMTQCTLTLDLRTVERFLGETSVKKAKESVPGVPIEPGLIQRIGEIPNEELLAGPPGGSSDDPLAQQRAEARGVISGTKREILGNVSERFAFSISVCVLILLAAALGIVFRGAHLLVAFGISFLPMLIVLVLIMTGKQLAKDAGTFGLGLGVMWTGILATAGVDFWTLTRLLRR